MKEKCKEMRDTEGVYRIILNNIFLIFFIKYAPNFKEAPGLYEEFELLCVLDNTGNLPLS